MPTITALNAHPARPGKIRVYIDEKYVYELSRKSIKALEVVEGEQLNVPRLQLLERTGARESAIGLLARRERSRSELKSALARKSFSRSIIEDVLNEIGSAGLQSDERFAASWIETRRRLSPRGKTALAFELKQRGLGEEDISRALAGIRQNDERATLRDLIASRSERLSRIPHPEKAKNHLLGFLSRRGFAYEDIRAVLAENFPQWA